MPQDHPQTPQSPSSIPFGAPDLSTKTAVSPRTDQSLLTPAHSANGSMSSQQIGHEEADPMDGSNKRKRDAEDNGDREQKKVHVDDSMIDIGALHYDVGPKYLFLQNPHPQQVPDTSADLFALYGLESLSVSVERFKPDGSKSVKMRKTYKNHIKLFGISGNFDSTKKEIDDPNSLYMMMQLPQDVWEAENTRGKEISKGLEPVMPSLSKAFTMAKGKIPKAKWDSSVLGEVAAPAAKVASSLQNGSKTPIPNSGMHRTKAEPIRAQRNIKKRSYGDASFEGYGEGFADSDNQEAGYSTNEGEDRGVNRKRPKKSALGHFNGSVPRQNNMVGV